VDLAAARNKDTHRIGGASVENLRLKPREATLSPAGISVIKAPTPGAAATEIRMALPKAKNLLEQARTIGSATEEGIRSAGFDVIAAPSVALPNHHLLLFPTIIGLFIQMAWQASMTRIWRVLLRLSSTLKGTNPWKLRPSNSSIRRGGW
jgi:hypothetical protein